MVIIEATAISKMRPGLSACASLKRSDRVSSPHTERPDPNIPCEAQGIPTNAFGSEPKVVFYFGNPLTQGNEAIYNKVNCCRGPPATKKERACSPARLLHLPTRGRCPGVGPVNARECARSLRQARLKRYFASAKYLIPLVEFD